MTRKAIVRVLALGAGLVLTAVIVRSLGRENLAEVARTSGPWIPVVIALEVCIALMDVLATRFLVGDAPVRARTWIRSSLLAYATCTVLPAGRMAGEAARAVVLKEDVGLGRAAAACARVQTASLVGTAAVSLVGALAACGKSDVLALALLVNTLICAALALAVLSAIRWTWLTKRFPTTNAAEIPRSATAKAAVSCMFGRVIQACQYGVVLHAVGGLLTARGALLVQGVHIVGATVGEALPNQLGMTEGAYRLFASAVGLGDAPARAVAIALSVRVAQLSLSGVSWMLALFSRPAA